MCGLLSERLSRALSVGVGEVPRQYRWTRKEAPTEPSVYLGTGLAPLEAFVAFANQLRLKEKQVS